MHIGAVLINNRHERITCKATMRLGLLVANARLPKASYDRHTVPMYSLQTEIQFKININGPVDELRFTILFLCTLASIPVSLDRYFHIPSLDRENIKRRFLKNLIKSSN
jgi:hypothetical protein